MIIRNGLFTSESVSEGHPDKLADQISDVILNRFLELDCRSRVACETLVADGLVVIAGEFKTRCADTFKQVRRKADEIARGVLRDAGCADAATGSIPMLVPCKYTSITNHWTSIKVSTVPMASSVPETRVSCSVTRPTKR